MILGAGCRSTKLPEFDKSAIDGLFFIFFLFRQPCVYVYARFCSQLRCLIVCMVNTAVNCKTCRTSSQQLKASNVLLGMRKVHEAKIIQTNQFKGFIST